MATTAGIIAAHKKSREMKESGEKRVHKTLQEKWEANPTSLRASIDAKCFDCIGGDTDYGSRLKIKECDIETCSLWLVRGWKDTSLAE